MEKLKETPLIERITEGLIEKGDPHADAYYDFMRENGMYRKLSFHDMNKIFNYFKENWRPK